MYRKKNIGIVLVNFKKCAYICIFLHYQPLIAMANEKIKKEEIQTASRPCKKTSD